MQSHRSLIFPDGRSTDLSSVFMDRRLSCKVWNEFWAAATNDKTVAKVWWNNYTRNDRSTARHRCNGTTKFTSISELSPTPSMADGAEIYISRIYRMFIRLLDRSSNYQTRRDLPTWSVESPRPPFESLATAALVIKNAAGKTRFPFMARSVCTLFSEFSICRFDRSIARKKRRRWRRGTRIETRKPPNVFVRTESLTSGWFVVRNPTRSILIFE